MSPGASLLKPTRTRLKTLTFSMQVIIPEQENKALHPVTIFKEGWNLCAKNLRSFIGPYLAIYLPVLALTLVQLVIMRADQQDLTQALVGLANIILSCWGAVVMINVAQKISLGKTCNFKESFTSSGKYLLFYLGAAALLVLTLTVIVACGVGIPIIAVRTLWHINRVWATLLISVSVVASVSGMVYFAIRWSLYGILCVVEEAGPINALKRSFHLIENYVNAFVAEVCLLIVAVLIFATPLIMTRYIINDRFTVTLIAAFYSTFVRLLIIPLWSVVFIGFYRKAKEAREA